jgi:hypothetical protein
MKYLDVCQLSLWTKFSYRSQRKLEAFGMQRSCWTDHEHELLAKAATMLPWSRLSDLRAMDPQRSRRTEVRTQKHGS